MSEESMSVPDEIDNFIEKLSPHLDRQINLEVDSNNVQEMLDSHIQELIIDDLIEIHEQEQDIEKLESLAPLQLEV
ncbi:hypothetical protein TNCV_4324621 [Trichonephila clavipes]|nr:hypothetical protein TNCV_4324621 [Trichonephila clavipes]